MLRTLLSGLRTRRLLPTLLAVALAVAFVAGTLVYRDTAQAALYDEYARAARNVGVAVTARDGARLPLSTVDAARAGAGVAQVDGRMAERLPVLDRRGRLVTDLGAPGYGINAGSVAALRHFDLRSGRLPAGPGEAALDARTAQRIGAAVGDPVTVVDAAEARRQLRVVGLVDVTGTGERRSSTVVLTDAELVRLTGAAGYREVVAALDPGTDAAAVRDRLAALPVAGDARVRTGAQLRHDLAREASGQLGGVLIGLGLFALVAVLVAGFVIYNTFSILMAQRLRETALLRCVGAGRAQVFRLVLAESAVVGASGSVIGAGLGVLVAAGLSRCSPLLGLPTGAVVLTALPLLAGPVLGVLMTTGSAVVPALRASRVPPIAALRAAVPGRPRRILLVLAAIAGAAGTAVTIAGLRTTGAEEAMVLVMLGGIGNFAALLLLAPRFVGPVVAGLGWLPGRLFGVPARLAVANARRNPARTSATTATLVIGVALMAGGSTVAATVNRTAEAQLNAAFPVDYLLTPSVPGGDVPASIAPALRADGGFDVVTPVRQAEAGGVLVGTVGFEAYRPEVTAGRIEDFGPGKAIVPAASDVLGSRPVGSRIELVAGDRRLSLTVAASVQSASLVGDVIVWPADFAALFPAVGADAMVLVRARAGLPAAAARDRLDTALADHPLVQVADLAEVREQRNAQIDQFVAVIAVLLAFALVIAVVGIGNTLSLSVMERTHESALVRALGLTRGGLRGMLLAEALLMALAGSLAGTGFGVLYGWLTATAAFGAVDPLLSVPGGRLAEFVALASAAAVLAAVLPARRAARTSIVAL